MRRAVPGFAMAACLGLGVVGCSAAGGDGLPFLADGGGAIWIIYPAPNDTRLHPAIEMDAVFRKTFLIAAQPATAPVRLRAFRTASIELNGKPIAVPAAGDAWTTERRIDLGPFLRAGANEIRVTVVNPMGPPALWLVGALPGGLSTRDPGWEVSRAGAAWRTAIAAADRLESGSYDPDRSAEHLLPSWRSTWPLILILSGIALGVAVVIGSRIDRHERRGPLYVAVALGLLLAALLLNNATHLPRAAGFDADGHLEYVRFIQQNAALPLADQGWQMYQPPLYYLMVALLLRLGAWTAQEPGAVSMIRLFNLGLGLANLAFVLASLRLLFPARPRAQVSGLVLAGFLPAVLLILHYPTNEALVVTLASGVTWAALRLLRAGPTTVRDHLLAGLLLGAAMLAKFSVLMLVPALYGALLWKAASAPRGERRERLMGVLSLTVTALLCCGWHYARVARHFGRPLIGNWDRETGFAWWQDPGYRMMGDYLRFGRSLAAPLFSGFGGVWDGFYSSLWGDGLCSGVADLPSRPPWAFDLMAVGCALALAPTLAIVAGATTWLARLVRRPDAVSALVLGIAATTVAATVYMTLRVPSYAQAKSFYALVVLVPICAFAAEGLEVLGGTSRWRRDLVLAGLCLWALTSYATFWTPGGAARTQLALGRGFITDGDLARGAEADQAALAADPGSWDARIAYAHLLRAAGASRAVLEELLRPQEEDPPLARRRLVMGLVLQRDGQTDAALGEIDRGLVLNPDLPDLYLLRAQLLEQANDLAGAATARREALRIDPYDAANHQALARLTERLGDRDEAARHDDYVRRLNPGR